MMMIKYGNFIAKKQKNLIKNNIFCFVFYYNSIQFNSIGSTKKKKKKFE